MTAMPVERAMRDVAVALRQVRPPLPEGLDWSASISSGRLGSFGQVWFRTRGCSWDRRGACTMCNYGAAEDVPAPAMVAAVAAALAKLGPVDELFVSPSGNFLDPREVPLGVRDEIVDAAVRSKPRRFTFETRPETVTAAALEGVVRRLRGVELAVGLGLESADPTVRDLCIQRLGGLDDVEVALATLAGAGVRSYANVSLGTAFLDPAEQVDDAVAAVRWALDHGADMAIVFPLHVKAHTVLAALMDQGLHRPPSLWALVECLTRIDGDRLDRVQVAWYEPLPAAEGILASPTSCADCAAEVVGLLDEFRAHGAAATVARLDRVTCHCRTAWESAREVRDRRSLVERVEDARAMVAARTLEGAGHGI